MTKPLHLYAACPPMGECSNPRKDRADFHSGFCWCSSKAGVEICGEHVWVRGKPNLFHGRRV